MKRIPSFLRGGLAALLALNGYIQLSPPARGDEAAPSRERILFDRNWRFQHGDTAGAEAPGFDDSSWRALNLPHDWMIEGVKGANAADMDGPFDKNSPAGPGGAYLDGGVGWYRKTFTMPASDQGKQVTLLFDGAYMNADVWLNGRHLGTHPYGFTSFYYDITPALKYGDAKNVLAVRLNVVQPSCRWYSGAGLYRDVWLIETPPVHVAVWGNYVATPEVTPDGATVQVQTRIENSQARPALATVSTMLLDPEGHTVAQAAATRRIGGLEHLVMDQKMNVPKPRLWSLEDPALYKAVTRVTEMAGSSTGPGEDEVETPFGIRTIQFTVDKGFFLNGKHVQIQGVCDHHDLGALGSAVYERGVERQLEILKSMGCNAIRTSHNPPAPQLLELCDRMGFLVMDEAFDEWKHNKTKNGYGQFFDQWSDIDIKSMVDRDRNHPSIILWSIGNEIPEGTSHSTGSAFAMAQRLVGDCHAEDPSRPVTSACPAPWNAWITGLAKALDVFGVNYNIGFYPQNSPENRAKPQTDPNAYAGQLPMVGSETQSQVDTRSEYGLAVDPQGKIQVNMEPDHQVSSYDGWWPGWGNNPDDEFLALERSPWVAGEFVWTGFDYLGEPTPYKWPSRSSYFGIVDLCGFAKDRYYQFKAHWKSEPLVHVMPHWTWPGFEGKPIPVRVYTNADSVELFLNGKSLGAKHFPSDCEMMPVRKSVKMEPSLHLAWTVPYEPGELKAVATKAGQIVATDSVKTTGAPVKIVAAADREQIEAGERDISFIKVSILDKDGNICPEAAPELQFALSGDAATIAGLDNGDPTNHESFQGTQHKAFHGLALAILKSHGDATGSVTLKISGEGLEPATVSIQVAPARQKVADRVM